MYTGNIDELIEAHDWVAVYPCVYREHDELAERIISVARFIPVYTGNIPIITYCFIIKILAVKFLPIFWDIFHQNHNI